jgi:hypothetical protein
MHVTALLALTVATSTSATCFTGGEHWASQRPAALQQLQYACKLRFATTQHYSGKESGACYDIGGGKMVNFNLKYTGSDKSRAIGEAECYNGFQKEVNNCEYGGASQYTNWRYT